MLFNTKVVMGRFAIPAVAIAVVALVMTGALGVASAEAPTSTTTTTSQAPTVTVQGTASTPIEQSAGAAAATAVYRQAMASAVTDGQAKAQFLASSAGTTLGAVQSIVEGGGYIDCAGENVEYTGEQPDFGSSEGDDAIAPATSPRVENSTASHNAKPKVRHHAKKNKHPVAKRASTAGCTLTAQVSLTYAIS